LLSLKKLVHPLTLVRITGILDGISLLVLVGIAMPLKYWADLPYAVTLAGSVHGGIFVAYAAAVMHAQIRLQWHVVWTLWSIAAAFLPFANFILERALKRREASFGVKPIPVAWLVYAIVLFTFLDLFTQLPVMSTYAIALGAGSMAAGFVVGMYSLTNTFGNVLAGRFTDRYGATAVMKAGLLLTSVALLLYNLVDDVQTLLIVRFVHGMLGGLIVPAAFTYMANMTNRKRQGSQSAVMGSFVGIAAVIGPAYSGIMAERSSVPFVFTTIAAIGLILLILSAAMLRERAAVPNIGRSKRPHQRLVWNGGIIRAFLGAFFLMFSQGALAYLLPQQVESLGYNPRLSGTLMSMFGIVAVALFTLPTNRWFDRIPPVRSAAIGLGLMGISQILISQSEQAAVLYAVLTLYGIGFALLFPSVNALLAHSTVPDNRGQVYGIFYALFSIGTVAGSSGLGLLPVSIQAQFLATGGALLLCAIIVRLTPMKQALVSKDA